MTESLHEILFSGHNEDIREFERIGEAELRYKIAHGTFFGHRVLAEEWKKIQGENHEQKKLLLLQERLHRMHDLQGLWPLLLPITAIIVTYIKINS